MMLKTLALLARETKRLRPQLHGFKNQFAFTNIADSDKNIKKLDPEVADYVMDPIRRLYALKIRKVALENTLLTPYKIVIQAKRFRSEKDSLIKLKKQNEVAGKIFLIYAKEGNFLKYYLI